MSGISVARLAAAFGLALLATSCGVLSTSEDEASAADGGDTSDKSAAGVDYCQMLDEEAIAAETGLVVSLSETQLGDFACSWEDAAGGLVMITGHDSFGSSVCYTSSYGELDYGPESIEGVGESALVMKGGVVVGQSEWAGSVCFSDGSSLSVTLPGDLAHEDPPAAVQALLVEMTSRL